MPRPVKLPLELSRIVLAFRPAFGYLSGTDGLVPFLTPARRHQINITIPRFGASEPEFTGCVRVVTGMRRRSLS